MIQFKKPTARTIRQVAEALMNQNGITTTLEVKHMLRNQGYWATQKQVSKMMDRIATQKQWFWQCNGRYRYYALYPEMMPNLYQDIVQGNAVFRYLHLN